MQMVVRVVEVIGSSNESWEDAAKNALEKFADKKVVGLDIVHMTANVENGKIAKYKTTVKLAILEE